jgi:DNA-binding CsgD family transcriptional regulator
MDQVVNDRSRANETLEHVLNALASGIIVLDPDRQIAWIDGRTRARLNGELERLAATLRAHGAPGGVNCSVSTVEVAIGGEPTTICVLQQTDDQTNQGYDAIAAIEAAMADTSWFTRTIIEKLKALRQAKRPVPRTSDLELLTDREREVLALICEGRSDAQMSAMLNLSHNTVRNHIASLYRKIGVNRRSAAIIWARERAITTQDALDVKRRKRGTSPSSAGITQQE